MMKEFFQQIHHTTSPTPISQQEFAHGEIPISVLQHTEEDKYDLANWKVFFEGSLYLIVQEEEAYSVVLKAVNDQNELDRQMTFTFRKDCEYQMQIDEDSRQFSWINPEGKLQMWQLSTYEHCKILLKAIESASEQQQQQQQQHSEAQAMEIDCELLPCPSVVFPSEGEQMWSMLPECKLENLPQIISFLQQFSNGVDDNLGLRYKIGLKLVHANYVAQLFELFSICETCENAEGIAMVFQVFKLLCKMDNNKLIEFMLQPCYITTFACIMEHSPNLQGSCSPRFVEGLYLKNEYICSEEAASKISQELRDLIEHVFRIHYVREFIFPQVMEEDPIYNLSFLLRSLYRDLMIQIASNSQFFILMNELVDAQVAFPSERRKFMQFLKEFFVYIKSNMLSGIQDVGKNVDIKKILQIIFQALETEACVNSCTLEVELLEILCDLESNIVREFAQENSFAIPLILKLLVKEDLDEYVCFCLSSSLKGLLVVYVEVPTDFIVTFFSEHFHLLIEPFSDFVPTANLSPQKIDLYYCLLEIFEICLAFHPAITKNIFMRSVLVEKIIALINPGVPNRLFLAAIRFFKVCMCMKDDYFSSLLIKKGFLKALINVLEHEGNVNSMVTSSVLSVFERIRKESSLKTMLGALVEGYGSMFRESFRYLSIFSELLIEYDKMFETPNSSPIPPGDAAMPGRLIGDNSSTVVTIVPVAPNGLQEDLEAEGYFSNLEYESFVPDISCLEEPASEFILALQPPQSPISASAVQNDDEFFPIKSVQSKKHLVINFD